MRVLPKTNREWFNLLPFTVRTYIGAAWLAVFKCHHTLSTVGLMPVGEHSWMKELIQPVQTGYFAACALLVGIGLVELLRHQRKQAIWNFAFAALAWFIWAAVVRCLTVPVK
jgi:hypothetical protein